MNNVTYSAKYIKSIIDKVFTIRKELREFKKSEESFTKTIKEFMVENNYNSFNGSKAIATMAETKNLSMDKDLFIERYGVEQYILCSTLSVEVSKKVIGEQRIVDDRVGIYDVNHRLTVVGL